MNAERLYRFAAGLEVLHGLEDGAAYAVVDDPFGPWRPSGRRVPKDDARLLAPILPSKVVAVGLNYRKHAAEMGKAIPKEPMLFLKPSTAVVGPGAEIVLTPQSGNVHYEGELAAVVGRRIRNADLGEARAAILGWTCLNDVTARDLQARDVQYSRAKGFDTFCPIGPCIARGPGLDPERLAVRTLVNGEVRQDGSTEDLIWPAVEIVRFAASVMTLLPGDVVTTGTPSGVGPLRPGDVVRVEIPGIGALENRVRDE